jgi:hypothetical protein
VTLYRQPNANQGDANAANSGAGMAAMQAIKRHSVDFVHLKDVAVSMKIILICVKRSTK